MMNFKTKQDIIDYIKKDALFLKFVTKIRKKKSSGMIRVETKDLHRAEDFIGEKLMTAMNIVTGVYDPLSVEESESLKINLPIALLKSQTFIMTIEVMGVLKEMDLPNHSIDMNIMPYSYMYVTVNGNLTFSHSDGPLHAASYLLIKNEEENKIAIVFIGHQNSKPVISLYVIEDVDKKEYNDLEHSAQFWIAMLTYMQNEKICSVSKDKMSYATNKKLKKNRPLHNIEVNTVSLPYTYSQSSTQNSDSEDKRHFNCRFTVRGHYRSQWYASEKKHRLIWIDSQIRGPENAPFKPKVYKVS